MTSLTLTVSNMKRAGLQNIKRKLFQKDFSKKKSTRIAEKPFYAYYDKPLTIKHIVKINPASLVV